MTGWMGGFWCCAVCGALAGIGQTASAGLSMESPIVQDSVSTLADSAVSLRGEITTDQTLEAAPNAASSEPDQGTQAHPIFQRLGDSYRKVGCPYKSAFYIVAGGGMAVVQGESDWPFMSLGLGLDGRLRNRLVLGVDFGLASAIVGPASALLTPHARFDLRPEDRWFHVYPFLEAGVGAFFNSIAMIPATLVGLGLEVRPLERVGLRVEVRDLQPLIDIDVTYTGLFNTQVHEQYSFLQLTLIDARISLFFTF